MSIVIDDPDLERTLQRIAADRGESVEDALRRILGADENVTDAGAAQAPAPGDTEAPDQGERQSFAERIRDLQECYRRNVVDHTSTDDELLGYDEDGLPS
jgi:hypothetical protein